MGIFFRLKSEKFANFFGHFNKLCWHFFPEHIFKGEIGFAIWNANYESNCRLFSTPYLIFKGQDAVQELSEVNFPLFGATLPTVFFGAAQPTFHLEQLYFKLPVPTLYFKLP